MQPSSLHRSFFAPAIVAIATIVAIGCSKGWTGRVPGYSAEQSGQAEAPSRRAAVAKASRKAPAPAPAASGTPAAEADASRGDFAPGTNSLEVREQAHVRSEPSGAARYIGKVTRGTRVGWKRVVAEATPTDETDASQRRRRKGAPCPEWVEIEPTGFLCRTLVEPSEAEPSGEHLPRVPRGRLAPHDYFRVTADETNVYKTPEDVRGEIVQKQLSTKVMVVGSGVVNIDGMDFRKTDHGLVDSTLLARFWPSDFAGVDLREGPPVPLPFAWVYVVRGGRKPDVLDAPSADAEAVRRATRREIVPVLEERDGFARIGSGEWIERKHLRTAALSPRPDGVGEGEQWIDVDLDEQVLVAYEGSRPVFATLVSTGKKRNPTPPGLYRVRAKAATTSMAGDPDVPNRYEVSAVPWAVRFRSGLFIHGVYWHDGFGGVVSHGCVNLAPKDAAFIYEWVGPAVPDGWSEIEVASGAGAVVRVRDREHPTPAWFDYTAEDAKQ